MKKHFWVSFCTIFLLTFISVAYASFSSVLTITGEATVAKDSTAPTCGSWYLRDSSLTTQEAYDQNKFINAGTNTTWTNTNKTLFIECTDNMEGEYGCINVDTVTTSGSGERYFKDVKDYTTSIKTDSNTVTVTLKDAYLNERTCTLPVGGSNPYIDKEGPTVTITRSAANKFTYSATDNMSGSVTVQYMVTTSSTQPAIDNANWSSTASEVTIDNSAAKTYYVWAKDGVNITHSTISTYLLTKTQGTGTSLTLKYQNNNGATLSTGYVLNGTQVYAVATPSTGYNTALIKKDGTTVATGSGTNSVNTTITVNAAATISSSATANTYSIGYTMNGGPNPSTKPTSGTYNANVQIGNPGSKTVTITGNKNDSLATVGAAVVTTQTFDGWTSTTMQGNAQSGSTTSNYAAWSGTSTKNTYFQNLRNDTGTVTMVANWNTSASTLPELTSPTGYTCKWYDTQGTSGGNELGGSGDPYTTSATSGSTVNVYARCSAKALVFNDQTITKTFSTSSQTANVTAATNGTGTYTYSKVSGESDITVSSAGVITIPASKTANTTGYTVVIRATDSNSGATKDATYTIKINKADCTLTVTNGSMTTGGAMALSGRASNNKGSLSYAIKTNGTTTASTLSNGTLTAGAMSSANDNDQSVVVTITDAGDTNYNGCSKDSTITVSKQTNTLAANNKTVYVSSVNNYADIVTGNNGGALTASVSSDGTTGGSNDTTNKKYTAGVLSTSNDNNGSVVLSVTSARTTTVAQKSVNVTLTVQKYTNNLSWSSSTPANNATLTYGTAYTATATAATNGGTNGSITYSSNNTSTGVTINSTSGAMTVVQGNGQTATITASMARTSTVKAASITRSYTTGKATCTMTVSNASMTTGGSLDLSTKVSGNVGTVTYAIKTNGTTTASTLSGSTLTAGAMSADNDNAQTVVVTATEATSTNYSTCSKDITITVNKQTNTLAANNKTVYVSSVNNYADIITGNNGGALTASVSSDGTTGGSNDTTNKKYTAGVLSTSNDNNGSVVLSVTSARTTTVAQKSVNVTLTVQKYTRALSLTINPSTVKYNSTASLSTTNSGSGGTPGTSVTYSSGTTSVFTVSGSTITAVAPSGTSVITATRASSTTVKAATATATATASKADCLMTVSNASMYTGNTLDLTTKTSNAVGTVTYAMKTNGTTSASSLSGTNNKTLTAGAMSSANDTNQTVVVTATEAASTNYNTCSKDITVTVSKKTNPTAIAAVTGLKYGQTNSAMVTATSTQGTPYYAVGTQLTSSNYSTSGSTTIPTVSTRTPDTYTVYYYIPSTTTYAAASGSASVTISKADCKLAVTNGSMYTTANMTLSDRVSTSSTGTKSYTIKTNGTTTASTLSNGVLTAGAMSADNDTAQTVVVTITDAGDTNYNGCSKDSTITVNKKANTLAANNKTVYVGSANNYADIITGNNGGALTASVTSDGTTGGSNDTTNKKYTAGVLSASNDNNGSVVLSVTSARTTTVAQKSVNVTLTVQKYTRELSLSISPSTVKYNSTATLSTSNGGSGGTPGTSITYSSGTTSVFTVSGNTITAVAPSGTSVITATRASSTTVKAATATATATASKADCLMTVSNASMNTLGTLDLTTKTSNAVGTVSYTMKTNGTTSASSLSGTNNKTLTAGAMSADNDNAQTVVVTATEAASTNYNTCSKDITVTVNKNEHALSWSSGTPANNAALAYGTSYTATATAATGTGTNGAITYSSGTTATMTINSSTGVISVLKVDGSTSVITASMARTSTVKAASITRTFSTTKGTCPAPTDLSISTAGVVTWTKPSAASSSQISIDNSTFTGATSGVDYNGTITASTGSRTVYVRSVCDTTYYSQYSSAASKGTTVFTLTLSKGTGVSAVSNNGTSTTSAVNYITGRSVPIDATVSTGYSWTNWTGSSTISTKSTNVTVDGNKAYTANATANTYTISYAMNNGTDPNPKPTSGTYNSNVSIGTTSIPTKTVTITGNANGTGATVGSATVNALTFNGWSSSSGAGLQGNAQSGSTTSNFAAWTGGTTTNKYFKNLRNSSGTVTLTANWSTTVTLPTLSKTGHTCSWYDTEGTSGGNQFTTTISQNASTSITIYARCTANTYNITLNQQNGSGGTATIYEKYGDGYYLTNNNGTLSNKMSTSANGVTIPTRSGYTFGGYYTSTNGGGTQYIDASGKLTSSASATQFSSAGNLYAKWTVSVPATPTISGGATKVYGSSATTLTCASSTTYPSGMTKKYQFGYATSDGGTPGNWTTESDANTTVIAANAYVGQRWYSCRVRVYDGSSYTGYSTSAANADTEVTINNATLTFNANGGTGGGTVYTRTGQSVVFSGIRNSTTTSIPSPGTHTVNGETYGFEGWYDAASGGNKILEVDGMFTGTAVSGYSTVSTWATTSNKTLYAHWSPPVIVTLNYNHTQDWEFEPVDPDTLQTRKDYEIFTSPTGTAVSRIYDSSITYKFEAWGAQGGASVNDGVVADRTHELYAGGQGAYAAGYLSIPKTETKQFYVFVGERPESIAGGRSDNPGGWNGGGLGRWDRSDNDSSGGGGGATDFRYFGSSVPSAVEDIHDPMDPVSLRYRVLVAGGGGGNGWASIRGHAGALQSRVVGNISTITSGQTKISYYTEADSSRFFGQGGQGGTGATSTGTGGGGGGWYGGAGGNGPTSGARPGNGGSSYVSGYTGCVAVASASSNTKRTGTNGAECTDPTVAVSTDNLCSVSFTGIVFSNPEIYAGWEDMPTIDGDDENPTMNGNLRHGFARVSIENARIKVTTGSSVGDIPAPFDGGSIVYRVEQDENGNTLNIPYEIDWHDANDEPISSNSIYSASNGTTWTAYGYRPVEYSVSYSGLTLLELRALDNPTSYNAEYGLTLTNPEDRAGETEYYQFTGWSGTDITGTSSSVTVARGQTGNRSYTANWTQKTSFNVTYDANGGSTSCSTSTGSYKGNWSLCSSGATRSGHTFKGWYTKPYGGTKVTTGGIYDKDYTLYAQWEADVKKVEFIYNIGDLAWEGYNGQKFSQNTFIDTYYKPDWSKTFDFDITLTPSWSSKRYLVIGNYDGSSSNSLNIEINTSNQVVVYVGTGSISTSFGSVPLGQESTIHVSWNGTTQKLKVTVSGAGSGSYENTITALTGTAAQNMRIGAKDYRTNATVFYQNVVKNLIISQYYSAPLNETITVPDPAGYYLLFEGWTGANGTTPQYGLTAPTGSTGVVTYVANWSEGVSMEGDYKSFKTSNPDIWFDLEIVVQYIDQARRHAYTRERVFFYREQYNYSTYGAGSMTVKYNGTSYTTSTNDKHITLDGVNMWSRYWDNRSNTFDSLTYDSTGNCTVTFKMTKFTHSMFTISNLPKTFNYKLPRIKPLD